jgi:hypothetical protein
MLGLRINLCKSELCPSGEVEGVEDLACILCCKVGFFPMNYCACHCSSYRAISARKLIIMERYLVVYNCQRDGSTLLKITLSTLPTHFLSHAANGLEKLE